MEVVALQRQGFVSAESRGKKLRIYKLRFRLQGRQRVHYLGTDPCAAERIKRALSELQEGQRRQRQLRLVCTVAAKALRETKRQLEPLVETYGFKFHGRAIRRSRPARKQI